LTNLPFLLLVPRITSAQKQEPVKQQKGLPESRQFSQALLLAELFPAKVVNHPITFSKLPD
jgi:hypothetical protein